MSRLDIYSCSSKWSILHIHWLWWQPGGGNPRNDERSRLGWELSSRILSWVLLKQKLWEVGLILAKLPRTDVYMITSFIGFLKQCCYCCCLTWYTKNILCVLKIRILTHVPITKVKIYINIPHAIEISYMSLPYHIFFHHSLHFLLWCNCSPKCVYHIYIWCVYHILYILCIPKHYFTCL